METNPYARASAPAAPAPGEAGGFTPEQQKLNDYSLAVAKNTDYYLPKFENFDNGGSRMGWNWPAFFITGPYFLYRKMWLAGFLYIFWPWILSILLAIAVAVAGKESMDAIAIAFFFLYFASWIVMPMCANSFYWSKINSIIRSIPRNIASQPEKRERRLTSNGGTNIVVPLIVYLFGGVFVAGIVAAVSIPAYQDYSIRTQVSQGLYYAADAKSAVTHFYGSTKRWPADNAEAGFDGGTSLYVEAVVIDQGSVILTFGGAANPKLKGGRIALVPGLNAGGGVVWVCGDGPTPDGVTLSDGPRGIEIDEKYLPSQCRGTPDASE